MSIGSATLLNSLFLLTVCVCVCGILRVFNIQIVSSVKRGHFIFSLDAFLSFSCLITLIRTSNTMLSQLRKS